MANLSPEAAANIRYQKAHLDDSRVPEIVASLVICLPLALTAVALRFLARRKGKIAIKADDWWIAIGLLFTTAFIVCEIYVTHLGLGRHAVLLKYPVRFAKAVIAKEVIYNPAIVAVKTSILLLYRRIFTDKGLNRSFNICLWSTGAFTLAYSIVGVFTILFHCTPINSLWNPMVTGHCINFRYVLIIVSSLNIGADILILCLPMPLLWRLKMPMRRKVQLTGIFLLGGFACVASIIRVPYIAATSLIDPSWSDTYGAIWSVVELTMGIVCACLPTLRPLYLHLFPRLATQASRSKTSDKSSSANSGGVKLRYLRMPGFEGNGGWSLSDPTNHRHEKDSKIPAVNEGESV